MSRVSLPRERILSELSPHETVQTGGQGPVTTFPCGKRRCRTVLESASCPGPEGSRVLRRRLRCEVQAPVRDVRFGICRPGICPGCQEPLFAPVTDMDPSTPLGRAFAAQTSGFPGENLFEPNAGAVGRTSAANPFEYVLRCCGPERAAEFSLRAEVERTNGTSLGVSSTSATTYEHMATSAPCRQAAPQPLKSPKNAKSLWWRVIKLVTSSDANVCQ